MIFTVPQASWYHCNRYSADSACKHCGGVVRHEPWCITRNPRVLYSYQVIADPAQLTLHDQLILHALGVAWSACTAACTMK